MILVVTVIIVAGLWKNNVTSRKALAQSKKAGNPIKGLPAFLFLYSLFLKPIFVPYLLFS